MEKPWRLHLANSAIHHLDIIAGDPALLAVWARDGVVSFFDFERGAAHGASTFTVQDTPGRRPEFSSRLHDPKDRLLPSAYIGGFRVWPLDEQKVISYDGRTKFTIEASKGPPQQMTLDTTPAALAVDSSTLLVAALDAGGSMLVGRIGGTVKTLKPGLTPADDLPLSVAVARGGRRIVVSDGIRLIVIDAGKVTGKRELHYACGMLAISPSGKRLMTFDSDSGVLRAYTPDDLALTRQRFVSDVLSAADELQLSGFADVPPSNAALSSLAVDDEGHFAFAVSGQVCAAPLTALMPTNAAPPLKSPVATPAGAKPGLPKSAAKAEPKPAKDS